MKIAQVCHTYLPHIGGLEFYVYRLSRDLKKRGADVEVITTTLGLEDNKTIKSKFPINYFKVTLNFIRNPFSLGMYRYFKKKSFDIIHLHSIWFFPSVEAILKKKDAKIITTVHGVYPEESSILIKFCLNIFKPIARFVCKKSDIMIVLSENEKNKLIDLFKVSPEKIKVIPNGIDTVDIKEIEKEKLKKEYGIKDEKIILFTGRIIQDKNPEILIKSLAYLNKEERYKVMFVGPIEDEYKKELINLAKTNEVDEKNIIFTGSFDPISDKNKLMAFYTISDIFISIGSWEGLPTRILEAMMHKVPCISYDPGNVELIQNKKNGLIIDKLDPKILGKQISILFSDKELAEKIAKNAWEFVKEFRWENIQEKIYNEYKKILEINDERI